VFHKDAIFVDKARKQEKREKNILFSELVQRKMDAKY
jgi:hypothetical protein